MKIVSKKKTTRRVRRNPTDQISNEVYEYLNLAERDYSKSIEMVEAFSGLPVGKTAVVKVPSLPKSVMTPGFVVGIIYAAKRDENGDGEGEISVFEHIFADGDAPILGISPSGREAYLLGGNFQFGDRGFVDDSDTKNHYPEQQNRKENPSKKITVRKKV